MKIQILSDLHLEMGVNPILKNFKETGDVLVLAGDITNFKNKRKVDEVFKNVRAPIVYVLGNHEYYGGNLRTSIGEFREWFDIGNRSELPQPKVHLLENNFFDFNGVRFIGTTYWSQPSHLEANEVKRCIADFRVIQDCDIQDLVNMHGAAQHFIKHAAEEARQLGLKVVVITHFPPSWKAREERFRASALGSYFYNNDDEFVELIDPAVWIYGHTHGNLRFKCGEVPVVTNQMGYTRGTFERMHVEPCWSEFDINYTVEV